MSTRHRDERYRRINAFDVLVLAGALVNVAVVLVLTAHWMMG